MVDRRTDSVAAIVPAAGRSSRFGSMKLLADIDGAPLLDHTLRSLLAARIDCVVVVVAPDAALSAVPALADPRVRLVVNPDPVRGMFSSIQTGLGEVDEAHGVTIVLPADMPFVRPETVAAVISAAMLAATSPGSDVAASRESEAAAADASRASTEFARATCVVAPSHGGVKGHPIALPAALRSIILAAEPTGTLRDTLAAASVRWHLVDVDDPGILRDVDTRDDLPPAGGGG